MDKKSKKIENLRKKQEQLKAQIQILEAAEKSRERKQEIRRKILVGAYYLGKAIKENRFSEIVDFMNDYLNRESDRILFDLPPIKSSNLDQVDL